MISPSVAICSRQTLSSGFDIMSKRQRSLANPAVSETHYFECLQKFTRKSSLLTQLGELSTEFHRVTPHAVMRTAALLDLFIAAGCRNGVVFPGRLETAIRRTLTESSHVPSGCSADLFAGQVAEHIRLVFGMLRTLKQEEEDLR